MTVRFKAGDPFGVPSGYEGANVPENFVLPSCGIEDVDMAMFSMFNEEIRFEVSNGRSNETKKVPVVFAAGEKWAMLKKGRALRDKTGALILPLVTIRRTGITQDLKDDIAGRGINQQTGELVIKRRLSTLDRDYQNLINKLGVPNQENLSDGTTTLSTDRQTSENSTDGDVLDGALMAPKLGKNIWEIITIPSPQFFTATYEVVFWAQYTLHMNHMLEKLMSSYLPTGNGSLLLNSPKGWNFLALVEGNNFTSADNAEDMSTEERLLQYKFTVKVRAFIVNSGAPGIPPATRRFISAPVVTFAFGSAENEELVNGIPVNKDAYDGADDPTRDLTLGGEIQPRELATVQEPVNKVVIQKNPFTGRDQTEYIRVTSRHVKTGEAILKPEDGFSIRVVSEE